MPSFSWFFPPASASGALLAGSASEPQAENPNKQAWLSLGSFLSLQYLQIEMARRRAAERSARGPACGDTRQRSGAEPSGRPDGNHGEII